MQNRKPIIQVKGTTEISYKNCFIGYAAGVEIELMTDLSKEQFEKFVSGKYSAKQIGKFELTGKF